MPKYYPKGKENESVKRSSWKELIEEDEFNGFIYFY